jgi:phage gp46-like protein
LYHTDDGGEVDLTPDGTYVELILDTGLETAAYLSMFGGNERDPGTVHDDADPDHGHQNQWWGNLNESTTVAMRSETANLLRSLPATTSNLVKVEQAAERDLDWFLVEKVAREIEVTATMTSVNSLSVQVRIEVDKQEYVFAFASIWGRN